MTDTNTTTPAPAPIVITWESGRIVIDPDAFFPCPQSKLRELIALATIDRAATLDALRAYFEERRALLADQTDDRAKKAAKTWTALLSVLDPAPKKTPATKAAERLLNVNNPARPQFAGVFESSGRHCITNGYCLIRYNAPQPLPTASASLDAEKAVRPALAAETRLELPTPKDLRALQRVARATGVGSWSGRVRASSCGGFTYDFGAGRPAVDLQHLLNMLEALPGCVAWSTTENGPIYFESADGDGVLLPIRPGADYLRTRPASVLGDPPAPVLTPEEYAARVAA